jgi:FkbM family methyltransferase
MSESSNRRVQRLRWLGSYGLHLARDRETRNARRARTHLRALRKISPQLLVVGVDDQGGPTYVHANDDVITPVLLARGHFQRNDFQRAHELAHRLVPRPGAATFVDVGANVGTTTLYAARTGAYDRIVSVEPSPDNLRVLQLNVSTNDLDNVVTVVAAACSDEPGEVELLQSSVSAGDHRVRRTDVPTTHANVVRVPARTLDDLLADAGVKVDDIALLWVDTQGHEPAVMAGGTATRAASLPWVIEFWPEMYVDAGTLESLLGHLTESFGTYIDLREAGERQHPMGDLRALTDRLLTEWHGQTDLLLLPRST